MTRGRLALAWCGSCAIALGVAGTVAASARTLPSRTGAQNATALVPWGVGEHLEYDVRAKELILEVHVGSGSMDVLPKDTVRGQSTWHIVFTVSGGLPVYRVNDRYESWLDTHTLASLRSYQVLNEGSYHPTRRYEFFPERQEFTENDQPPKPSVAHPLDEGSLLFFIRTIPFAVGMDTSLYDYFDAARNPVDLQVTGRERITVPAGTCDAMVIKPIIHTSGLFSKGGQAQVWLSDDSNHIMLQMKSKLPIPGGQLNLYLKSYRLAGDSTKRTPACKAP